MQDVFLKPTFDEEYRPRQGRYLEGWSFMSLFNRTVVASVVLTSFTLVNGASSFAVRGQEHSPNSRGGSHSSYPSSGSSSSSSTYPPVLHPEFSDDESESVWERTK